MPRSGLRRKKNKVAPHILLRSLCIVILELIKYGHFERSSLEKACCLFEHPIPASSKVRLISTSCPINRFCTRTTFLGKPEFLLIHCCQARFSAAKMPDQTTKIPDQTRKYPTTWADNFSQRHLFSGTAFLRKNGDNSSVFEQRQK